MHPKIEIEQMDQIVDQLISQLYSFKRTIAVLRDKISGLGIPDTKPGLLTDSQKAQLLNKREKAIQKRIDKLEKAGNNPV